MKAEKIVHKHHESFDKLHHMTSSLTDEFTVCPAGGVAWWL